MAAGPCFRKNRRKRPITPEMGRREHIEIAQNEFRLQLLGSIGRQTCVLQALCEIFLSTR